MADAKISDLAELTRSNLTDTDEVAIVDDNLNTTKKITSASLYDGMVNLREHIIDVAEIYGDGATFTDATIQTAITAIGANETTLWLKPDTWTISDDITFATTTTVIIPRGVTLNVASGKVVTFNGSVEIGNYPIKSGSGTIAFGSAKESQKEIELNWFNPNADGGTNDGVIISEANQACGAGATLIIRKASNTYSITSTGGNAAITMKDQVSWQGIGMPELELVTNEGTNTVILWISGSNDAVNDLFINGIKFGSDSDKDAQGFGISAPYHTSRIRVIDCEFEGLGFPLKVDTVGSKEWVVDRCTFVDCANIGAGGSGGAAAVFTNAEGMEISNCNFRDIGTAKTDHCIYANQRNTVVTNCYAEQLEGYFVSNGANEPISVSNCAVKDCYGAVSGTGIYANIHVVNADDASGTVFFTGVDSSISNCSVDGYAGTALAIASDVTISNCDIETNTTNYNGEGIVYKGSSTGSIISNCVFKGTSAGGTTTANDFISFGATNTDNIIQGCYFEDVTTGAVVDFADQRNTFKDNYIRSTDGNTFHTVIADINNGAPWVVVTGNRTQFDANAIATEYDFTGVTGSNGNKIFFENNLSSATNTNFPTVASAGSIICNSNSGFISITGTTDITTIEGTVRKTGKTITLKFNGSLDLKHGTGNLKLVNTADVSVTDADMIQLIYDGTNWNQSAPLIAK